MHFLWGYSVVTAKGQKRSLKSHSYSTLTPVFSRASLLASAATVCYIRSQCAHLLIGTFHLLRFTKSRDGKDLFETQESLAARLAGPLWQKPF